MKSLAQALSHIIAKHGPRKILQWEPTQSSLRDHIPVEDRERLVNLTRRAYEAKIVASMIAAAGRPATALEFGQWRSALEANDLDSKVARELLETMAAALKIQLPELGEATTDKKEQTTRAQPTAATSMPPISPTVAPDDASFTLEATGHANQQVKLVTSRQAFSSDKAVNAFITYDTSFKNWVGKSLKEGGDRRWPFENNAQYPMFGGHPILDASGNVVGAFDGAAFKLGYTYHCVYSNEGNLFYMTHSPVSSHAGFISLIKATGRFWFKEGEKFEIVSQIPVDPHEFKYNEANLKLTKDGYRLLLISKDAFSCFGADGTKLFSKTKFVNKGYVSEFFYGVSPDRKVFVAAFGANTEERTTGIIYTQHSVEIYDCENASLVGHYIIKHKGKPESSRLRSIDFGPDGQLAIRMDINSEPRVRFFDLVY